MAMLFESSIVQSLMSKQIQAIPFSFTPYKSNPLLMFCHFTLPVNYICNLAFHIQAMSEFKLALSPMNRPTLFNHHPTQQLSSIQVNESYNATQSLSKSTTFQITRHCSINARFVNRSPTNLSKTTTPLSKSLSNPTKLLSYCYWFPLISFRLSTIIFI